MKIELYPLEKVVLDGATLALGMTRAAVEAALGKGERIGARHYYFNSELALDYRDDRLELIEFLGGIDGALRPTLDGLSVFETDADALAALLRERSGGAVIDAERGYSYQFPPLGIGVYREAIPEEVAAMLEEAARDGAPMSPEDIACERRRAEHWATLALAGADYYR